jgi:Cu/Zn superoxide dismutase
MIKTKNRVMTTIAGAAMMLTVMIGGCKKEDDAPVNTTTYDLKVKDQLGISGTVTFTETSSSITTIDIALTGGDTENHPAHIHVNSAIESGAISISLNPVVNGHSSTQVSKLDNNSAINYSQLIAFDGYLNVHESSSNLTTILAQTDIGGNALTTTKKSYTLNAVGASGVTGTATFEKRKNGNSLVTIDLNGTLAGGIHPAVIHIGSVATVGGGPVVKTLNPVDGTTGKSYTTLRTLDSGTPISYDDVMLYDGYLAIHESELLMANVLCQGNIGSN